MNSAEARYLAATIQTSTIGLAMVFCAAGMAVVATLDGSSPFVLWLGALALFLDSLLLAMATDGYNRKFWERVGGGFGPYPDELKEGLDRGEPA